MIFRISYFIIFAYIISFLFGGCTSESGDIKHSSQFLAAREAFFLSDINTLTAYTDSLSQILSGTKGIYDTNVEALGLRALIAVLSGDHDKAATIAHQVIHDVDQLPDSTLCLSLALKADMEYVIGQAEYKHERIQESFKHLQKSLNFSRAACCPDMQIYVPLLLSHIGCEIGDVTGSLTQLRKVESIIDTLPAERISPDKKIRILSECSGISIDLCDVRQADRTLAKAGVIYDKVKDRNKIIYLEELVRFRFLFDRYSQASSALNRLEMLVRKVGYEHNMTDVYISQGLARSRMGELEWAEKYLRLADTASVEQPIADSCLFYLLKGEVALLSKKYDHAREALFDLAPKFVRNQFHDFVMHESQRSFYIVQGRYEEAYNILADECRRSETMQNDIFSFNDRQRDETTREQELKRENEIGELRTTIDTNKTDHLRRLWQIAVVALFTGLLVYVYVRYRMKKTFEVADHQNVALREELALRLQELETQSQMLEQTNIRISESIAYAERIQHSMSPPPESLNNYPITGSFIFYSPLDVVSGDFFWFTRKGDCLIICCADCTGHGVPGAFMSMIATTIINDICDRMTRVIPDPAQMLEKLDQTLLENLAHNHSQSGNSKDGLDISIAVLNLLNHQLTTSSARRPVIIVKDGQSIFIKGAKRSIGERDLNIRSRRFVSTTTPLSKGDCFYMFSDGYSDQFGGTDGDKMKNSKIERFLLSIYEDDMDEQCLTVQELFTQWKGEFPQIDDVLFMGIKV